MLKSFEINIKLKKFVVNLNFDFIKRFKNKVKNTL